MGGRAPRRGRKPASRASAGRAKAGSEAAFDPNEEVVVPPYLRGTLALLAALPADRPTDATSLAKAVGRRTAGWNRFVGQLLELRLADDVGLDGRPLLLATPAGLLLRERLCQKPRRSSKPVATSATLLERLGLERLALLEAVAEFGPLRLTDLLAGCRHLPGTNREPPLLRSRFAALARRPRLLEPVPGAEVSAASEPGAGRYHATDAAWRVVAARRRLHPDAYDLGPFAGFLAAQRAEARSPLPRRRRPRRPRTIPGQLSLF
jgi:hypothetical protein